MYTSLFMSTYPGKRILRNGAQIKALDAAQTSETKRTWITVFGEHRGALLAKKPSDLVPVLRVPLNPVAKHISFITFWH